MDFMMMQKPNMEWISFLPSNLTLPTVARKILSDVFILFTDVRRAKSWKLSLI